MKHLPGIKQYELG